MSKSNECRMYPQEFPDIDSLVMGVISHVDKSNITVYLPEYNTGGLVLTKELSGKRIRTIRQVAKLHEKKILRVIEVDTNKGYIDLSIKSVKVDSPNTKSVQQ